MLNVIVGPVFTSAVVRLTGADSAIRLAVQLHRQLVRQHNRVGICGPLLRAGTAPVSAAHPGPEREEPADRCPPGRLERATAHVSEDHGRIAARAYHWASSSGEMYPAIRIRSRRGLSSMERRISSDPNITGLEHSPRVPQSTPRSIEWRPFRLWHHQAPGNPLGMCPPVPASRCC